MNASRVLHVVTSNQRRGAESFAVTLADALESRSFRNRVIALGRSGAQKTLDVEVIGGRPRSLPTLLHLRRAMRDADMVVAHGSKTLSACWLAGLRLGRPTIYQTIGDLEYWTNSRGRLWRTRFLFRRMDSVVALSTRTRDVLQTRFGIRGDRISVIGNGRAASQFPRADDTVQRAARQMWDVDIDRPIVAVLGSLSEEKRVDVAIRALGRLPEFELLVAGDGTERGALERLAAREAPGRVRFLGTVDNPSTVLAATDVLLLTSDSEGLPGVLIEAGLVGRPSVATDVGFVSEIVRDGLTGVLVPTSDPAAVSDAVRDAYVHRAEFGSAAFAWTASRFELEAVVARWRDLLRTMVPAGDNRRLPAAWEIPELP
jgi:glycosyltransferase involved in cell wall biosynthesis